MFTSQLIIAHHYLGFNLKKQINDQYQLSWSMATHFKWPNLVIRDYSWCERLTQFVGSVNLCLVVFVLLINLNRVHVDSQPDERTSKLINQRWTVKIKSQIKAWLFMLKLFYSYLINHVKQHLIIGFTFAWRAKSQKKWEPS